MGLVHEERIEPLRCKYGVDECVDGRWWASRKLGLCIAGNEVAVLDAELLQAGFEPRCWTIPHRDRLPPIGRGW